MKKFLRDVVLYALPVLAMLVLYCGMQYRYFPAPHLTNNLALNEKAAAYARLMDHHVDVLACGSSMTLNNLSTPAVLEHFKGASFYNLGAWGLDVMQTCDLIRAAVPEAKPKTVVLVTNLMDFAAGGERSTAEMEKVIRHVHAGMGLRSYLADPGIVYYLRRMETNRLRFTDRANYECLMMDENGGVFLQVPPDRILPERWDRAVPGQDELDSAQYIALGSLAHELHVQAVRLIVIAPPYRKGVLTPEARAVVAAHNARLGTLMSSNGQIFVDATDQEIPEAGYCDSSHLNREAAEGFTRYALGKLGK